VLSEPRLVMHEPVPPPITVGGLPIRPLTRSAWARLMVSTCLAARATPATGSFAVFFVNGQVLALSHRDKSYRALLVQADALDADGRQLLLATPLPERAATTDLFHDAARAACVHGLRFYFLGATAENIEIAVATISRQYPALQIAGWRNGYFRETDEAAICAAIVAASTDVLWVGLGVPHQEAFVVRNRERLRGVGWIKTCGGLFDYFQPTSRRAPQWMQKAGIEWMFRAAREPRKYLWRYATTNGTALWLLLTRTG
jgi:N-acetylglucosaminyldiphosphoundecaprenol N-acetyl-beta-D-mannosaminyltransferase